MKRNGVKIFAQIGFNLCPCRAAVFRNDARLDKVARSGALPFAKDGDAAWKRLVETMAVVRDVSGRILMRLA